MTLVAEAQSRLRALRMQKVLEAKQVAQREALQAHNIDTERFMIPKADAPQTTKETLNPKH
jgi:hypothetical protein